MNSSWMRTRQTRFTLYTTVYVVIVLAALTVINFLANRYNKSYDTTSNKQFTLSDQTTKLAQGLKDNVTITYWDQPTKFQGARDLLGRYKALSQKIDVQYQDADKNRTQAIAQGVKTLGTIFVEVGNKRDTAKSLTEEEVTGAMVRVLKGGDRSACFVLGSGEHAITDTQPTGYSELASLIDKNNYKTQSVKLIEKAEIPKDCTLVVVGGPRRDYIPTEVDALKNYVEGGGRAIFMLDPPLKFGREEIDDNAALSKVLESWGVSLDKDLVLDTSGVGQIFGLGPEYALISNYGTHAIVRAMKDVPTGFPIVRSMQIKNGDKTTVEKLFETSDATFATNNLASAQIKQGPNDKKGAMILAAAGTYSGAGEGGKGRFIVVGSSTWVANSFLRFNGNRDLIMNMLSWLSSDEDLISIRPKEPTDRRINVTRREIGMMFYSSIVLIPLLTIMAGVGVWWRRR